MRLQLNPKVLRAVEILAVLCVLVGGIYLYWKYEYSPRPVGFERDLRPEVEAIYSRKASISSRGTVRILLLTDRVAPGCNSGDPMAVAVDTESDQSIIGCWHANKNTIVISWQDNSTHLYSAKSFEELKVELPPLDAQEPSTPSVSPHPPYQKGTT